MTINADIIIIYYSCKMMMYASIYMYIIHVHVGIMYNLISIVCVWYIYGNFEVGFFYQQNLTYFDYILKTLIAKPNFTLVHKDGV